MRPGSAPRDEAAVDERQVLGQRERTIPLPRGGEHDRVPALGEQLDDAVEVASLRNVVEEEKDAHAVRRGSSSAESLRRMSRHLIIIGLLMPHPGPRAAAYALAWVFALALAVRSALDAGAGR